MTDLRTAAQQALGQVQDKAELRARLRALAAKMPPDVANWPHERIVRFKAAIRAANIAADHPGSLPWMLESRWRDLQRFYQPPEP